MKIILTEGDNNTFSVELAPSLERDYDPKTRDKWDAGTIGLILLDVAQSMIQVHIKDTQPPPPGSDSQPTGLAMPSREDLHRFGR